MSPTSLLTFDLMAKIVNRFGGCIVNVDYGDEGAFSDSIRAIKDHKYIPSPYFWQIPGECDLSAYVNFSALATFAEVNKTLFRKIKELKPMKLFPKGTSLRRWG